MNNLAISVEGLSKCYQIFDAPQDRLKQMVVPRLCRIIGMSSQSYSRDFWALRNVSFQVKKGETVGIIGRNGSGKSTLLQLICGTLNPTSGSLATNGRIAALLELGAGFNPEFTGRENVFLNSSLLGLSREQTEARFGEIAAFADIGEFMDQPIKTYSSGMYSRLAFANAIHVDPDILIVDEALAVGDQSFQKKCLDKFYAIRESGCTILFVSHDPYQIRSACSRGLYLRRGDQVFYGDAATAVDLYEQDIAAKQDRPALTQLDHADQISSAKNWSIKIISVDLRNFDGLPITVVKSGQDIAICFTYSVLGICEHDAISFVVNLYRHDGLYICGSTSVMDGLPPFHVQSSGSVAIEFPKLNLLSGRYKWRVAINDSKGLGILTEATPVCEFSVVDDFSAVGLIDLNRRWIVS